MKGVDALIATVLIIAITVAVIAIVFQSSAPSTNRAQEVLLLQEAKNNLKLIDNAVKETVFGGEGSARSVTLAITGGQYAVDEVVDSITFAMQSREQIVGVGVSKMEDGVNLTGSEGVVTAALYYTAYDLSGGGILSQGNRKFIVRNDGYDSGSGKQKLSITLG